MNDPIQSPDAGPPGFGSRGRARRRARFLRKARELAYRDLGGLVFNLHRFGQRNDALVLAKLGTLANIDGELRALESSLRERRPVTVLREAGITACARCAAIHSSEDRFCPNCGLAISRNVDLPIAAPASAAAGSPLTAPPPPAAPPAPTHAGGASPGPITNPGPVAAAAMPRAEKVPESAAAPATGTAPLVQAPPTPQPGTDAQTGSGPAVSEQGSAAVSAASPRQEPARGHSPEPPTQVQPHHSSVEEPTEIVRPPATGA
jgi:hypothetical protein